MVGTNSLEQWLRGLFDHDVQSPGPVTLFQQSLVELADRLNDQAQVGVAPRAGKISHEHEAAVHIHETIKRILG